jgi:catechol 2,3-dioxygenase-like lactoylglutathione lyase family enzyme
MYKGSGVHHVAIGVRNLAEMKSFYQDTLEFNKVFIEGTEAEREPMRGLLRTSSAIFAVIMFGQEASGILVELARMTNPAPRPIRNNFRFGDIGVSKITIAVSDVKRLYKELKGRVNFCSKPKSVLIPGWGDYQFVYCKDPEGNLIEFNSGSNIQTQDTFGGVSRVGISVTDLQRSISFYQKYFGFDKIVINIHESFSGHVNEISQDNKTRVRSCVLANSNGGGMVELFEVLEPRGRSIPFATNWGDFGYLQACFYCENIREMKRYYEKEVMEFLSELELMDDGIPEHAGLFMYMKDLDGIPIELLSLPQQI